MVRFVGLSALVGQLCQQTFSTDASSLSLVQIAAVQQEECTHNVPPTVFYLGLPHAGSTSMSRQLGEHPSISMGKHMEPRLWVAEGGELSYEQKPRSLHDYLEDYTVKCKKTLTFDGTPFMLLLGREESATNCTACGYDRCQNPSPYRFPRIQPGPAAIQDFKTSVPSDPKFLVLFRDPMEAAASHYPFGTVEQPCHACDADNLETWLNAFPKQSFLFMDSAAYFADPQKTMDGVFKFLGVEPWKLSEDALQPAGRRRASQPTTMQERVDFWSNPKHKECKRRLEGMTGLKFSWEASD